MALGIMIDGEMLQLFPGTTMELEDFNPFLQFTEDGVKGGFSFPTDVKNTPKNLRLLRHAGIHQKRIDTSGIDGILYDGGLQHGVGKIKVEKTAPDLNNAQDGIVSIYYLSGASNFFQDIKDKRLREITAGGDRSFAWDGLDSDTGVGFWRHIHLVANAAVNAYDYAFYPVSNDAWEAFSGIYPQWMNRQYWDPAVSGTWPVGTVRFSTNYTGFSPNPPNRIVPFPYLHYILKSIFSTVGWTLKGDILSDATFLKITMLNFRAINWARPGDGVASYFPNDPVVFNLKDHLPDTTISNFLIQIKNRFGWYYQFDRASKTCTIRYINDAATGIVKDYTKYADPVVPKNVLQQRILYSLITNDGVGGGKLDLTQIDFKGRLDQFTDLPAPGEALGGHVYLIVGENNYYQCESDGATWSWEILNANLYDYIPENATDEITTEAGTVSMGPPPSGLYDLMPRLDHQGIWVGHGDDTDVSWGIHLLFYHGIKQQVAAPGTEKYCYASNHIYDVGMNQVADWGLTWTCFKTDGTDVGLYETFWKKILELLKSQEELELTLYLPRHLYMQLDYTDQLVIAGVRMFIKTKNIIVPYENKIKLVCIRI